MTSTTTLSPAAAQTQQGPFHEHTGPYVSRTAWLVIAAMAAVMSADVLLAKNTFDVVARDSQLVSWVIALSVAGAATFIAFAAGKERRKGKHVTHIVYVALWFLLGLGMAVLRFAPTMLEGYDPEPGEMLMAGFIFVLHLVAGAKLMQTAYDMTNPMRTQLRAATRAERKAARKLAPLEAVYARTHETLSQWQLRMDALAAAAVSLKDQAGTHGEELKQRARLEVAATLNRVEASSVYRQESWPEQSHSDGPEPDANPERPVS